MCSRAPALLLAALTGCALPHAPLRASDDASPIDDGAATRDALAMDSVELDAIDASDAAMDAAIDAPESDSAPRDAAMDAIDGALDDALAEAALDATPVDVAQDSDGTTADAGAPTMALYNRPNGALRFVASNGARYRNGPFMGRTTTQVVAGNFLGASDGRLYVLDGSGSLQRYWLPTDPTDQLDHDGADNRSTLNGNALNGSELRVVAPGVPQYLGATDNRLVYTAMVTSGATMVRRVIQYAADWNHDHRYTESWATFTGGGLDAVVPSREVGLHDFAGNVDVDNNYWLNVESDGTLEFYWLGHGMRDMGLSNGSLGNWTALRDGPLAGLTLAELNRAASGTFNGSRYRYFGTSNDDMVFEISSP